jgi:hypothetical protein
MAKLIKDWEGLVGLESEHYKLEIDVDGGNGWIVPKIETEETEKDFYKHHFYLSTHTFYGRDYKHSTEVLQEFGFDVELDNWDKEVQ